MCSTARRAHPGHSHDLHRDIRLLQSFAPNRYPPEDVPLLEEVANQIALAVENMRAYEEIARLRARLEEENRYLQEEIKSDHNFEEIVGQSRAIKEVFRAIEAVAPVDATVLITGETGTGKELVARTLQNLSSRRGKALIKVNCAALQTGLIESELFGHEKGAFTGAVLDLGGWPMTTGSRGRAGGYPDARGGRA